MLDIHVNVTTQRLKCGPVSTPCAIGTGGFKPQAEKREGDGATPLGTYPLKRVFYRADRLTHLRTGLNSIPLSPQDGWCDAVGDTRYNQFITHPYPASAEHLWREDEAYDLIVVFGYNDSPIVQNGGSAIFLHVARVDKNGTDLCPTRGCIAIRKPALLMILRLVRMGSKIMISPD